MSAPAIFHVTADGLEIEVQFFSPEIVRILKYPAGNAVEKRSFAVVMQPEPCRFTLKEAEGLTDRERHVIALAMAIVTAPWTFFIPVY